MKRREFLKTSLAATALSGLATTVATAAEKSREYYELRIYRLKDASKQAALDDFLANAAIPALNRLGIKPVGAFTEMESKDGPAVYLLIPYPSLESFAEVTAKLPKDPQYLKAGDAYLHVPKKDPVYDRIESWLMLAFAGQPKLEQPSYSKEKKDRIFELRSYQSHSEERALKKVDMFNAGEIEVMHKVGLGPIFYGQVLIGENLPHLTYMLSGENMDEHKKHWAGFMKDPTWNKLKNDPQYADAVSKISNWFLKPTSYSQI